MFPPEFVSQRQLHKQELAADLSLELEPIYTGRFEARLPPVSKEELDAVELRRTGPIPAGWVFHSADFSLQSINPAHAGTVLLKRDASGTVAWFLLDEEERMKQHLFIQGYGMTMAQAIADAVVKVRRMAS